MHPIFPWIHHDILYPFMTCTFISSPESPLELQFSSVDHQHHGKWCSSSKSDTFLFMAFVSPTYKLIFEVFLIILQKGPSFVKSNTIVFMCISCFYNQGPRFLVLPLRWLFDLLSNHLAHHHDAPLLLVPQSYRLCFDGINNLKECETT